MRFDVTTGARSAAGLSGFGTADLLVMNSEPFEEKASPVLSIKRRTRFG
jgi:hypothetical protein